MSAVLDKTAVTWMAKLPASKESGIAEGFDGRRWLAGYFEASAIDRANSVFLDLGGFMVDADRTPNDLWRYVVDRGTAMLLAWASTMAICGCDAEPWAKDAADKAALIYRQRVEELLATADTGGSA